MNELASRVVSRLAQRCRLLVLVLYTSVSFALGLEGFDGLFFGIRLQRVALGLQRFACSPTNRTSIYHSPISVETRLTHRVVETWRTMERAPTRTVTAAFQNH